MSTKGSKVKSQRVAENTPQDKIKAIADSLSEDQILFGVDAHNTEDDEAKTDKMLSQHFWLWKFTDFDKTSNWVILFVVRMIMACTLTWNYRHADQYWQATQVAYNWIYGGVTLPWEWHVDYALRNSLYPAFLAGPLWLLKVLGLDYKWPVLLQPYIQHNILVLVGDWYMYEGGKKYVGKNATRIGMIILFFCKMNMDYTVRCFTNSVEQILGVIAFYYFLEQRDKFNKNTVWLTATITLSFMIRNTSPIGWIPLLAIKVLYEGSLVPFLISALLVSVPVVLINIALDTLYFTGTLRMDNLVFTALNFVIVNIKDGLSEYFGSSDLDHYYRVSMPNGFWLAYPVLCVGVFYHIYARRSQGKSPYLSYLVLFYVLVFSLIPHKEPRFMLPIFPAAAIMAGEVAEVTIKHSNQHLRRLWSLVNLLCCVRFFVEIKAYQSDQRGWIIDHYLSGLEKPIHSLYTQEQFVSPHYSWFHGHGTKVRVASGDPQFARVHFGHSYPLINKTSTARCASMLDEIMSGDVMPQYVSFAEEDVSNQQIEPATGLQICRLALEGMRKDGEQLYFFDRWFPGEVLDSDFRTEEERIRDRLLFRLNPKFTPYMD